MEIVSSEDVESVQAVEGVHLAQMAAGEKANIQEFSIEPNAEVPEHSHAHEQIGVITRGTLTFVVDGEEETVDDGDTYVVPGDEPHAAYNDGEVPVEGYDIFSPPRTDVDWQE